MGTRHRGACSPLQLGPLTIALCGGFSIRDSQIDGPQDHQTRHREDKGQPEDPHFPANRRCAARDCRRLLSACKESCISPCCCIFTSNLQETSTTRTTSTTSCFLPSRCRPSVTQLGDSWMSSSAIQAPLMMPEYFATAPSSARHCFSQLVGSSLETVVIPAWKNQ